jgi:hypothetical protein
MELGYPAAHAHSRQTEVEGQKPMSSAERSPQKLVRREMCR